MCGIVGYVGSRDATPLLLDGLRRLEYRGYDSCGIAILENGTPKVVRTAGRIRQLEEKVRTLSYSHAEARCGIGHTRWATHGRPCEENAHPHADCTGHFLVAHNGIIENYAELRRKLSEAGHRFLTETDTEVLPHLIESHFRGSLEEAIQAALSEVEGAYGVVVISTRDNQKIVAARRGPPLVLGFGNGENFVASDSPALLPYTREMLYLEDHEIAVIRCDSIEVRDAHGRPLARRPQSVHWTAGMAEKEGYPHFMLKEIFEQPRAIRDTLRGRLAGNAAVTLEDEIRFPERLVKAERLSVVACGTSLHAGLIGRFMIETLARVPVDVDCASEFRYRDPMIGPQTMVVAISQSGETADTLAALREARDKGAYSLSICNVVGSMAARQSDDVLYTRAGPEIGVASTKAFTAQLAVLYLLALYLGRLRGAISRHDARHRAQLLEQIPEQMERVLEQNAHVEALANIFHKYRSCLYLGRGINYPVALEGALKLKEISYIHAEGYPAGEIKHGPIALIDREMPVVVIAPLDSTYKKTLNSIDEVKARGGIVLAVVTQGDCEAASKAAHAVAIPPSDPMLNPLLAVLPLQLFSYHAGVRRGCDVDKPRNLAKSVTVE